MQGGNETSEDHDEVGEDGDEDFTDWEASQESQVEEEQRGGDGPVNVSGHKDFSD